MALDGTDLANDVIAAVDAEFASPGTRTAPMLAAMVAQYVAIIDYLVAHAADLGALVDPYVTGGGGVTDHGALTGLGDNDHPQYALASSLAAVATSGSAADLGTGTLPAGRMPALTGDVTTIAGAVATTIAANAVTNGKFRQSAALAVVGRSANSVGDVADIVAAADGDVLRRSGTTLGFGAIPQASVTSLVADLALKAPLASPTFTGTVTIPTPAVDDDSTKAASTAYVQAQKATANPAMDGTAAAGTSTKWSPGDHVHPTDTSRAPLASPTFTGVPAAPTAAAGTNTTQLATTAFVTTATSDENATHGSTAYTTPGTYNWTIPLGAEWVKFVCYGAGGGGGGGGAIANGAGACMGGGGGGGGARVERTFLATDLGTPGVSTVALVVPSGGAKGTGSAAVAAGTDGTSGAAATVNSTKVYAGGGGGGRGGAASGAAGGGGGGGGGIQDGSVGTTSGGAGGGPGATSSTANNGCTGGTGGLSSNSGGYAESGGGGGGGHNSTPSEGPGGTSTWGGGGGGCGGGTTSAGTAGRAGTDGGGVLQWSTAGGGGGTGGTAGGTAPGGASPGGGNPGTGGDSTKGGSGGGGGGSARTDNTAGGTGAVGGSHGGGGGGGGCGRGTGGGGNGGDGGQGAIYVMWG